MSMDSADFVRSLKRLEEMAKGSKELEEAPTREGTHDWWSNAKDQSVGPSLSDLIEKSARSTAWGDGLTWEQLTQPDQQVYLQCSRALFERAVIRTAIKLFEEVCVDQSSWDQLRHQDRDRFLRSARIHTTKDWADA